MCVMLKLCLYAERYMCTSVIDVKILVEVYDVAGFERGECRGTPRVWMYYVYFVCGP